MIKRIKKELIEEIESRDEMEDCVRSICMLTIRKDEITTEMDEAIAKIRDRYQVELMEIEVNMREELDRAHDWCDRNPDDFGSRKSIEFVHGTVGYRTGQFKAATLSGWTWKKVLAVLKSKFPEYVRRKEEADKEKIIADRIFLKDDLKKMGVKVFQEETFYVEPKRETETEVRS